MTEIKNNAHGGIHFVCIFCGKLSPGGICCIEAENIATQSGWKRSKTTWYEDRRWTCKPCRHARPNEIIHTK